jgi:hypothetical protein
VGWSPGTAIEVLRQREAEQHGEPERHVGVAGEVVVDLKGVAVDGEQRIERPDRVAAAVDAVDRRRPNVSASTTFFMRPVAMRASAASTSAPSTRGARSSCGKKADGRTIGPATRCGKKERKRAKSRKSVRRACRDTRR